MMSNFGGDVGSAPQYSCQETRTDENKESPPIGFALEAENPGDVGLFPREISPRDINANNFIRPQRFSCKGSDTDPAPYNTYWYDGGKTFSFTHRYLVHAAVHEAQVTIRSSHVVAVH